jgi:hypothetical protein
MSDIALKPDDAELREPVPVVPSAGWWRHRGSFVWMAIEVALISASVFLGLAGQQWYESRKQRDLARDALGRIRAEVAINREEVTSKLVYHKVLATELRPWVRADPKSRGTAKGPTEGLKPPFFETTAWDLAISTQALANVDLDLAFAISKIYRLQRLVDEQTKALTQAMFLRPPWENGEAFLYIIEPYYSDLIGIEPILLTMYDEVLPAIDRVLGE